MEVKNGPYVWYFIWSCLLGTALAVIYDLLRLSRRIIKTNDLIVNIQDILFLILSGAGSAYTAYFVNNGIMRVYAICGTILGFSVYRVIFGENMVRILELICHAAAKILSVVVNFMLMPIRIIIKIIGKPIFVTVTSVSKKLRRKLITTIKGGRMHKKRVNMDKSPEK